MSEDFKGQELLDVLEKPIISIIKNYIEPAMKRKITDDEARNLLANLGMNCQLKYLKKENKINIEKLKTKL